MSKIFGIFNRTFEPVKESALLQLEQEMEPEKADYREHVLRENIGFGHLMIYNTPESKEEILPYYDRGTGLLIAADARIDNREELLQTLKLDANPHLPDSQLILKAYKTYGRQCTEHLLGAFAFAIWNETTKELFCARDHIGFKPFYYYLDQNLFIFSSEYKSIASHPGLTLHLNEQFVADALSTLKSEHDVTFYNEIRKLPPAHQLTLTEKHYNLSRYWDLDPAREIRYETEQEYVDHFLEILKESVRCRLRSAYPVGTELSGGIDSSAVTGIAAHFQPVNTFSHSLPDWALDKKFPYKDERTFYSKVNRYCNIARSYSVSGEQYGILQSLQNGLSLHGGIQQSLLNIFSDALYEKAEETGTRTLLSGFGGDELVSYKGAGYWKELAYHHRYGKLFSELKHSPSFLSGGKQLLISLTYASLHRLKKWMKLDTGFKTPKWSHDIFRVLFIENAFFRAQNVKQRFYQRKKLPSDPSLRMRQYRRFHYSYFPMRLENCNTSAQSRKIEYRYPLLDKRLLEFYLALPAEMKIQQGWGRYILRKALEGFLPRDIQWRNDKLGNTIPAVNIRMKKDYEAIRKLIEKARKSDIKHYIDYDKALEMLDKIASRSRHSKGRIIPQAMYSALMLLLYQLENTDQ